MTRPRAASFRVAIAMIMALVTAGCVGGGEGRPPHNLDPDPDAPIAGITVDRLSAPATAEAFASFYASGDTRSACLLGDGAARASFGALCESQQGWSTTLTADGQCSVGDQIDFHFTAPAGALDGASGLDVRVQSRSQVWWVTSASRSSTPDCQ